MKFIINFILSLQFIFKPEFWLMNDGYDAKWDRELNELIDNDKLELDEPNSEDGDIYYARYNDTAVWIQNYPYAYATKGERSHGGPRPSRLTILKLRKHIQNKINQS